MTKRAKSLPRYLSGWAIPLAFIGIAALVWGMRAIRRFAGRINQDTELTVPLLLRELILPHTVLVLGLLLLSYSIILLAMLARHLWQTHRRNLYRKEPAPLDENEATTIDIETPDTHAGASTVAADGSNTADDDELSETDAEKFFEELLSEELKPDVNHQPKSPPKR